MWCWEAGQHNQSQEFPSSVNLKLVASKGDPTGLGYKVNNEIGQWRQEYRHSPLFSSNPPTNPCPKVPMTTEENYSTTPMKNWHIFGVWRPTFKHTIITSERGTTWLAQVAEIMAHRAIWWLQGVAGGWLRTI